MVGLIGNLSLMELLVIALLAVLVFGRRLPEVAAQAFRAIKKTRGVLEDMRRESGLDQELHRIQSSLRDVTQEVGDAAQAAPAWTRARQPSTDRAATPPGSEAPEQDGTADSNEQDPGQEVEPGA